MSSYGQPPATPNRIQEAPPLMRMMHPSSGRNNFNDVPVAPPLPPGTQLPPQISAQVQQAIMASGVRYPNNGPNAYPGFHPNAYTTAGSSNFPNAYLNAYPMSPNYGGFTPYNYDYGYNNPYSYYYPYRRQ